MGASFENNGGMIGGEGRGCPIKDGWDGRERREREGGGESRVECAING